MTATAKSASALRPWPAWAPAAACVAVVAAANGWAIPHLAGRWAAEAPTRVRAARIAEERKAEAAAQAETAGQVPVEAPLSANSTVPLDRLSPAETEQLHAILERGRTGRLSDADAATLSRLTGGQVAAHGRSTPTARAAGALGPVEWRVRPQWRLSAADLPSGSRGGKVSWSCDAAADGRLTACRAVESPAGNGLARATRQNLMAGSLQPSTGPSRITLSITWSPPVAADVMDPPPAPGPDRSRDLPTPVGEPFAAPRTSKDPLQPPTAPLDFGVRPSEP